MPITLEKENFRFRRVVSIIRQNKHSLPRLADIENDVFSLKNLKNNKQQI